jgi:hypothetical protein
MNPFLLKHRTKLSKIILIAGALIYFAFGFAFLIFPDLVTTMDGIVLPGRPAANHIRAVFGGMEMGLGMLLIYFCLVKDGVKNGLIVLAFSIGATALSRLYGIAFDQGGDMSNILSFVAEFSFAFITLGLFMDERRRDAAKKNMFEKGKLK